MRALIGCILVTADRHDDDTRKPLLVGRRVSFRVNGALTNIYGSFSPLGLPTLSLCHDPRSRRGIAYRLHVSPDLRPRACELFEQVPPESRRAGQGDAVPMIVSSAPSSHVARCIYFSE